MIAGLHPLSSFEAIGMDRLMIGFGEIAAMEFPAFVKLKSGTHGLFSENQCYEICSTTPLQVPNFPP